MKTLGQILCFGSGGLLWLWSLAFYYALWGGVGLVAALILVPLVALFPVVYLVVMGFNASFLLAVILWLLGLVGMFMVNQAEKGSAAPVS